MAFKSFRRAIRKLRSLLGDSWAEVPRGYYIKKYRAQIDAFAKKLGAERNCVVRSRFNRPGHCAELVDRRGQRLAIVKVHGAGGPQGALVQGSVSHALQQDLRKAFDVPIKFEPLEV